MSFAATSLSIERCIAPQTHALHQAWLHHFSATHELRCAPCFLFFAPWQTDLDGEAQAPGQPGQGREGGRGKQPRVTHGVAPIERFSSQRGHEQGAAPGCYEASGDPAIAISTEQRGQQLRRLHHWAVGTGCITTPL